MSKIKFPIAIVGYSMRLPGGINCEDKLWKSLLAQEDLVTEIPEDRWNKNKFFSKRKDEPGKSYTFSAGVIDCIQGFDNNFFGISPRESLAIDPQHRMLLELTWEALESGTQNPDKIKGSKCAVYVGISGNEYSYKWVSDVALMGPYSMTGTNNSIASNRVSYSFDLHGPSLSVDTACSSSLVALHHACNSIWNGESDSAIAAGSNLLLHPMPFVGFSKAGMLSPDGHCHSFDDKANGYVRAEGAIVLFLKPLSQAEKDQDPIHAVILNSGINSDGDTAVLPLPSKQVQSDLIKQVYSEVGINPSDIDYIEAHGTGTSAGDPIEISALSESIATSRTDPLLVGSIKSNMGHLETASGLAGVVKAIASLKHNIVPATLSFSKLNSNIDFEKSNIRVLHEATPIKSENSIIGVNSFGFGGTNAHVVLQKYSPKKEKNTNKQNFCTTTYYLSS